MVTETWEARDLPVLRIAAEIDHDGLAGADDVAANLPDAVRRR